MGGNENIVKARRSKPVLKQFYLCFFNTPNGLEVRGEEEILLENQKADMGLPEDHLHIFL